MWTFQISSGNLCNPDDSLSVSGYAGGDRGRHPEGINNPDMMSVRDIGPLPAGLYRFGDPVEHSQLGAFAIPLIPDPGNEMFGRSGFYCHGDLIAGPPRSASDGCMIFPLAIRKAMWNSSDHELSVTV